ncbi:acetate/propionate family kinase [Pseudonocardia sp. MH-G8]|uniref:acetate/propionate family kinase n=1 Tax=Pseudonocardia sp. MH-G8 TaxID=1854588 RepID=UPI000BA01C6B|nr:acetate/propionate family kinase [Pseudonocardia sp. MH-G8]OZM75856.1 acetate kinase [Pseudonocardia sp. MH-G8]
MRTLVINAGSSSVKIALLDGHEVVSRETVEPDDAQDALGKVLEERVDAVGHRVVHGGTRFTGPTLVDDDVLAGIEDLRAMAPLHQGPALDALRQARAALPDVAQVACFDTAFHTTMPAAAHTYAVPARWRDELRVRRYGFHGLAHEWSARRAAELLGRPLEQLRTVTAHLGSGASLCAVDRGRSVDTTMGFTPTAGLVMGTRSGDLDPSVPPYVIGEGLDAGDVATALDRKSGLQALAGSSDLRDVLARVDTGDDDATLALDVWVHRARALVAAMAAAMGGVDVLAFSGGVGEHQPRLRAAIVDGLGFLGLALDAERNAAAGVDGEVDAVIGADGHPGAVVVLEAREDLVIAGQVRDLLEDGPLQDDPG